MEKMYILKVSLKIGGINMKIKLLSVILAVGIILSACSTRDKKSSESEPELPPDSGSEIIEPGDDEPGDEDMPPEESSPEEEEPESEEEKSVMTMAEIVEFIKDYDGTKRGWGPGRDVNDDNRPLGSVDYQNKYGQHGAYFIAPNTSKVYLTFDEGYENGYTVKILDTLKEKNVKAVFFITYPYAEKEKEIVTRMIEEGHVIGNHSTKHLSFPDMSAEDAVSDIKKLHDYVRANYGYEMTLFRPPMGEFSEKTLALANSIGYKSIFWSFAYRDWEVDNQPISIEAIDKITSSAHPGAIYLLHAVSSTNAEILGEVIDNIREKGFEFGRFDWA